MSIDWMIKPAFYQFFTCEEMAHMFRAVEAIRNVVSS
jgi:hypothetical protein